MDTTTFSGLLATYTVHSASVERVLSEDGQLDRLGIPSLHLWALREEGDDDSALYDGCGRALDAILELLSSLDNTEYEEQLISRFLGVLVDFAPVNNVKYWSALVEKRHDGPQGIFRNVRFF